VGADIGEVVNPNSETLGQRAERASHGPIVLKKRPRSARSIARENHMHGTARADRSLELAAPASDGAAMLGSNELRMNFGRKEGPLHPVDHTATSNLGQCYFACRFRVKSNRGARIGCIPGR